MTDTIERITVAGDGITLSLLVWRRFRQPMPGLVERILALPENRGLAALEPHIPVGTVVTIPIDAPRQSGERTTVRLW